MEVLAALPGRSCQKAWGGREVLLQGGGCQGQGSGYSGSGIVRAPPTSQPHP